MALEAFKILNHQGPVYLHDMLNFSKHNYSPSSFRYSAAKLWTSLPQHFRDETCFKNFKSLISAWNGESCACTFCSTV